MKSAKTKPAFDFTELPPVGYRHRYFKRITLTLEAVKPYTRKDGSPSVILNWRAPDGRTGTSGLRSNSIVWDKPQ
jgi:hypothetical protein